MQVVYERCCGIDVHKKEVVVTFRMGRNVETRRFGTYTQELRELTSWLKNAGCQMIAMESTGSYWKPLYNIFEIESLNAMIVNAQHMRAVPGRKTDVKDSEWIADLLQHGLLKPSFIPDREQRELRELTLYRKSRIEERAREINRLEKMLEGANIKLTGALSHITGTSAKRLLDLVVCDKPINLVSVESCRHGLMRSSAEELVLSLTGIITPLQRELLREMLRIIQEQTVQIERIERMVDKYLNAAYAQAVQALNALPGIGIISAHKSLLKSVSKWLVSRQQITFVHGRAFVLVITRAPESEKAVRPTMPIRL